MTRTRSIDELLGTMPAPAESAAENGPRFLGGLYALAIFLSAFLLFQVQPLIGKCILPWFGGTPGVWTACLLFFQVLLFGGYAYAHWTARRVGPRAQMLVHLGLLVAACAMLPIAPNAAWKPTGNEEPVSRIVLLLAVTVGLPFFVLSTTGPLLQSWFSRTFPGRSPYRLYALSNGGSLLALVSFPAVFEWAFPTKVLTGVWSWTFVAFAVVCGLCAWMAARRGGNPAAQAVGSTSSTPVASPIGVGTRLLWLALAMVPSVLLLATTNQVCLDVASVPFLWIAPLMLYLLTFILCFDSDRWYSRRWVMPAAIMGLASVYYVIGAGSNISLIKQIVVYFAAFFLCALVCHGELARRKPPARDLTLFYLLIAGGGAAGGIFVAVVAPLLFSDYLELHLGLLACAGLMVVVLFSDSRSFFYRGGPAFAGLLLVAGWGGLAYGLLSEAGQQRVRVIASARNFFGVLRVTKADSLYGGSVEPILALWSGRIAHGFQYQPKELRHLPTAYYNRQSGVGRLLSQPTDHPRRVGLVGLGVGTLAAYARPGDVFHFYEINPAVERLARAHFDFLSSSAGKVDVTLGDARFAFEREKQPQNFDVLVLDAFSGDAIPVHLLTQEAFAIYERHLAPDGVIAVHISNRHFSLRPVVEAAAEKYHFITAAVDTPPDFAGRDGTRWISSWILLSRSKKPLEVDEIRQWTFPPDDRRVVWTDDHVSLADVYWLKMLEREQREASESASAGRPSP